VSDYSEAVGRSSTAGVVLEAPLVLVHALHTPIPITNIEKWQWHTRTHYWNHAELLLLTPGDRRVSLPVGVVDGEFVVGCLHQVMMIRVVALPVLFVKLLVWMMMVMLLKQQVVVGNEV